MEKEAKEEYESLELFNHAPPPLVAGKYTVHASQTVKTGLEEAVIYEHQQDFYVSAPRFRLDPAEIQNVYPPEGKEGNFYKSLPHVVFSRKTLPWERVLKGDGNKLPPWMALLLLDEDEIKTLEDAEKKTATNEKREPESILKNVKIWDIIRPNQDDKLIRPNLTREDLLPWEQQEFDKKQQTKEQQEKDKTPPLTYTVLDLPVTLFCEITPAFVELEFTAHVRKINTKERADTGIDTSGWHSVLMGNRLPTKNKKNTVFLVSLEGHEQHLVDKVSKLPDNPATDTKIRLCVLHDWSFTSKGLDFQELVKKINENIGLHRYEPPSTVEEETVKTVLEHGYVPVNHHFRDGSNTVSWYRGPLAPLQMSKRGDQDIHTSPDSLLRYDPNNGMLNTAYSSAWQLGRLLGLQNQEYAKELHQWSEQLRRQTLEESAKQLLTEKNILTDEFEDTLQKMERDELMQRIFFEDYLANYPQSKES